MTRTEIKNLSKEEFLKLPEATQELYEALQNSKSGYIKIKHAITGDIHYGYTDTFGEGISCFLSNMHNWYTTSIIKHINWEEKYFDTLNSRYYFEFTEDKNDDKSTKSEN